MKNLTNGTKSIFTSLVTMLIILVSNSLSFGQSGCAAPPPPTRPYFANQANQVSATSALAWTGYGSNNLLSADFENKTVGATIGTGGASQGEPASIYNSNIGAVVQTSPMSSKSLELVDNDTYSAGAAIFEFMNNREITTGNLEIRADLFVPVADNYYICLREQGSAAKNFLDLDFLPSGTVQATYQGGTLGSYPVGRVFPILIVYRASVGLFDVWLDGKLLRTDIAHSVTGRGVGGVYFGIGHDADLNGRMYVDNISATWDGGCNSTFDMYLGTDNPPTTKVASDLIRPVFSLANADCGQRYFWKVVEKNSAGTASSPVWSFTTDTCQCQSPIAPAQLFPASVASNIADNTYLAWTGYNRRTLLRANFEDKAPDVTIGTGGASMGEPWEIYNASIGAKVKTNPMPTKSLEIVDNDNYSAGSANFQFLNNDEISNGIIEIRADLWFASKNYYTIYLREQGGASKSFLNLDFLQDGTIQATQTTGGWSLGTYPTGRVFPLSIVCDMNSGKIDIWMDGRLVGTNITHGQVGRGIGGVYFGIGHDPDLAGTMYVDNISVTHENDCGTTFDVYLSTANPPVTKFASNLIRPYVSAGSLECGKKYFWNVIEKNSLGSATSSTSSFVTPHCACPVSILEANFNADAVNQLPNPVLSADPIGDALTSYENSGTIRVRAAIGTLVDHPVEMNQVPGTGSLKVTCTPVIAPVGAPITVGWRSFARANFNGGAVVIRGSNSNYIASVNYLNSNRLLYNSDFAMPIPGGYISDVDQAFVISIDFANKTTSLSIDGVSIPGLQNVPFAYPADDFGSFNVELGGTTSQVFVFDDVWACDDPPVSCCRNTRGNVNGDPQDKVDLADLSMLVAYLTQGNLTLGCVEEADINGSGVVDISDLAYLVNNLTGGGVLLPSCGGQVAKIALPASSLTCSAEKLNGQTIIHLNSSEELTGLQIALRGSGAETPTNLLDRDLEIAHNSSGDSLNVVLIDLDGKKLISKGDQDVIALDGDFDIISLIASDVRFNTVVASLAASATRPSTFALGQNFPNPFNPTTTISFSLPSANDYKLRIYNVAGQVVKEFAGTGAAGNVSVTWDGAGLASGVYFYRLQAGAFTETKKMMLLK